MHKQVHLYQISDAMQVVLENGGEVSFVTRGFSMVPFIRNRMDTATLRKPTKPLKKGDVIFYRRDDGAFVLHRIVGKNKDGYILRGDNQPEKEYGVREDMVIAVLVRVKRAEGKIINVGSFYETTYRTFLPLVRFFRFKIYPIYVKLFAPLVRKILKK